MSKQAGMHRGQRKQRGLTTVEYAIAGSVITASIVLAFSDLGGVVATRINDMAVAIATGGIGGSGSGNNVSNPAPNGNSASAPGQTGSTPGLSGGTPAGGSAAPGQSQTTPGQSGGTPAGSNPGKGGGKKP